MLRSTMVVLVVLAAFAAAPARADLVGLTEDWRVVTFTPERPDVLLTDAPLQGFTGSFPVGIDYDPVGRRHLLVTDDPSLGARTFQFDPRSGQTTPLGDPYAIPPSFYGVDVDPADGTIHLVNQLNDRIRVAPDTGQTVFLPPVSGPGGISGLAFENGTVFGTDSIDDQLVRIGPDGTRTLIGPLGADIATASDLEFIPGGVLAGVTDAPAPGSPFFLVDHTTGAVNVTGQVGADVVDLAIAPEPPPFTDPPPPDDSVFPGLWKVLVAADAGVPPIVARFDWPPNTAPGQAFFAYDNAFQRGVRVATLENPGGGIASLITTVPGMGGNGNVRAFKAPNSTVRDFFAFDAGFRGASVIALEDLTGDGIADDIIMAEKRRGRTRIFDGRTGQLVDDFIIAPRRLRGSSIDVGPGDDGIDLLYFGTSGRGPQVRVFNSRPDGPPRARASVAISRRPSVRRPIGRRRKGSLDVVAGNVTGGPAAELVVLATMRRKSVLRILGGAKLRTLAKGRVVRGKRRTTSAVTLIDSNGDGRREIVVAGRFSNARQASLRTFRRRGRRIVRTGPTYPLPAELGVKVDLAGRR